MLPLRVLQTGTGETDDREGWWMRRPSDGVGLGRAKIDGCEFGIEVYNLEFERMIQRTHHLHITGTCVPHTTTGLRSHRPGRPNSEFVAAKQDFRLAQNKSVNSFVYACQPLTTVASCPEYVEDPRCTQRGVRRGSF